MDNSQFSPEHVSGINFQLKFIFADNTSPYHNLAFEEYLLWHVQKGECILYLWQNRHTVVIGVNQNPWKECHVRELEQNGGFLARRMSGGGAVFHDLGNLNFTFLTHDENYDVDKQLDVIVCAVKKFGIHAEKSGRNDLLANGKKFSGNAFYHSNGRCFHHGTLLVDADMYNLSRYLNVSQAKLQSKGVSSVRSRVINLKELAPELTITSLQQAMIQSFGEVYGETPQPLPPDRLNHPEIKQIEGKYASYDWRLGRRLPFTAEYGNRFAWGELTLQFCIERGIIQDAVAYSDGMETNFIKALGDALKGITFSSPEINRQLLKLAETEPIDDDMLRDIIHFISENNF
jgi:lipoate-protein ligase A